MKKILIVEEPESCETCPLRSYSNMMLMCTPMREAASDVECPLKPMPEKKYPIGNYFVWNMMCQAWNECLDEINATEKVINAKNVALKGEKE